jgi:hypothetical protein
MCRLDGAEDIKVAFCITAAQSYEFSTVGSDSTLLKGILTGLENHSRNWLLKYLGVEAVTQLDRLRRRELRLEIPQWLTKWSNHAETAIRRAFNDTLVEF